MNDKYHQGDKPKKYFGLTSENDMNARKTFDRLHQLFTIKC